MDAQDRQGLLEILDDRYAETATIISAQLPICEWHAAIGDPVVGGAILDRMVSAVIKIITTRGRSYRREVMGRRKEPESSDSAGKSTKRPATP